MNFDKSLANKSFFKFTGPPENWLTAIKFMTWGLESKYQKRWSEIQPGDIFFMHSTSTGSKFKNARAGIIGFGVVSSNFTIKDSPLWIKEFEEKRNIWPLLVPFSEIYLFSNIPEPEIWEAPDLNNQQSVQSLIDKLLSNSVPLALITGFPQMGSFSSVSDTVVFQIINNQNNLHLVSTKETTEKDTKLTPFIQINDASESLRYAETLQLFDQVNRKVVSNKPSFYSKDNELLARAEDSHANVLQGLIDIFKGKNYITYQNRHVDLFAVKENQSYLIEVKSTENRNFRDQARKGIVQLFEYEYFEVKKFLDDSDLTSNNNFKVLVPSQEPKDPNYVAFINSLETEVGVINSNSLLPVGEGLGISRI